MYLLKTKSERPQPSHCAAVLYKDRRQKCSLENVSHLRNTWSFISVRLLSLCSWHNNAPRSPCSWAFSAWYLASEPTQSNNCLAQGCFRPEFRVPPLHLAKELSVVAGVEVLYLPVQSNCCLRPSLLQAAPRHWQQIRRRAHSDSGLKKERLQGHRLCGNIIACIYHRENFEKIMFWDIS